jgi:predicted transcriptional regulator
MSERAPPGLPATRSQCDDILQCVMSLNPLEVLAYETLVEKGPLKADELAKEIRRDRSTAYRCLRHLISCRICYKETRSIEKGGYFHIYIAESPDKVKTKLEECTEQWYRKMKDAIKSFSK